jgi:RNA-directed DNA polymerase
VPPLAKDGHPLFPGPFSNRRFCCIFTPPLTNGNWVVQRKTAKTRFRRAVRQIGQWCRRHRHLSVAQQWQALSRKLRGHDAYYGITGNARALVRFRQAVRRVWRTWLNRRAHRPSLNWETFVRLLQRYPLPPARVVHSHYVA